MYEYTYKDLTKSGYKRVYLSKKDHNEIFKYRKKTWKNSIEYYANLEEGFIHVEIYASWFVKLILILMFPINLIFLGLANYKEVLLDYKKLFNEKKHGSFVSEVVFKGDKYYERVLSKIKVKE